MKAREATRLGVGKAVRAAIIAAHLVTNGGSGAELPNARLLTPPVAAVPSSTLEQRSTAEESADRTGNRAVRRRANLDRQSLHRRDLSRGSHSQHQRHHQFPPSQKPVWHR